MVDEIYDQTAADAMGIGQVGKVCPGAMPCQVPVSCNVMPCPGVMQRHAKSRCRCRNHIQVCVMIHSGSRGLGHQVATDALAEMERTAARDKIVLNDRQLACARISSWVCMRLLCVV